MKTSPLVLLLLLLSGATGCRPAAQQTKVDQRSLQEVRAKAEAGDADSQVELAARYDLGEGVTKNPAEALKWFRKAADQNHARGQNAVGVYYFYGEGVGK